MSTITELEMSLQDLFETFDQAKDATDVSLDLGDDVREIRTDLVSLAGTRPAGKTR